MNQPLLPSGLHDLLPPDAAREQAIITALLATFAQFGYEQVTPPLVEFEETLLQGQGKAYEALTFRVMDPESRQMMGVRADITTQVARIASTRMDHLARPLRLSYAGRVLRARPQGLSPDRQLVQSGIEIVGAASPRAMTEVIAVSLEALAAIGSTRLVADLTFAGLLGLVFDAADAENRDAVSRQVKRKDLTGLDPALASTQMLKRLLGLSGAAEAVLEAMRGLALPAQALTWIEGALRLIEELRERFPGLEINVDPLESQGFEYQEGLCFSLFDADHGLEVGRGGGYVIGEGAEALVACGSTLYIRRLMECGYLAAPDDRRVFLPLGTPENEARRLRGEGHVTVRALGETDDAASLRCSGRYVDGRIEPLTTSL